MTEVLWILLYIFGLCISSLFDDTNLLIISMFILGISVVDVGLGFIFTILQKNNLNTDSSFDNTNNIDKFYNNWNNYIYISRYLWNYK